MSKIASEYGTTVAKLKVLNNLTNVNYLYIGEKLKISGKSSISNSYSPKTYYKVKAGNTVSYITSKYSTTVARIQTLNNLKNVNKIYIGETLRVK